MKVRAKSAVRYGLALSLGALAGISGLCPPSAASTESGTATSGLARQFDGGHQSHRTKKEHAPDMRAGSSRSAQPRKTQAQGGVLSALAVQRAASAHTDGAVAARTSHHQGEKYYRCYDVSVQWRLSVRGTGRHWRHAACLLGNKALRFKRTRRVSWPALSLMSQLSYHVKHVPSMVVGFKLSVSPIDHRGGDVYRIRFRRESPVHFPVTLLAGDAKMQWQHKSGLRTIEDMEFVRIPRGGHAGLHYGGGRWGDVSVTIHILKKESQKQLMFDRDDFHGDDGGA